MPKIVKQSPKAVSVPANNGTVNVSGWDLIQRISLLVYGDSGTGKTTLWATFPGPIKALICSGGNKPGELRSVDTPENRRKIQPVVITHTDQLCDEVENLQDYETVVLDHVDGLASLVLKEYQQLDDLPAVKRWGMATQADWGNINQKCIEILRHIFNSPCHIVIVGHERIFRGSDDGNNVSDIIKPAVGVSVTPGVCGWLRGACDYEGQMYKRPRMITEVVSLAGKAQEVKKRGKGVEYCLRTEPHDYFMTKFRILKGRQLPECIVDPSYEKIKGLIEGKF